MELTISNPELDKRVKLSKADKASIIDIFETGQFTQIALAEMFKVSRQTITFIVNPEARGIKKKQKPISKDRRKEYNKKHRKYKRELSRKGLI